MCKYFFFPLTKCQFITEIFKEDLDIYEDWSVVFHWFLFVENKTVEQSVKPRSLRVVNQIRSLF